jgi:hypothetical protein
VDGDDAQPGEDRISLGLVLQEDGSGGLAGVLDQLARGMDGMRHGPVQLVVVVAVELVLVPVRPGSVLPCCGCGFGRGLHEPRPG